MSYLSPVKLRDDPNLILWELPPGKVDKSDPTKRVVQKAQKGGTCWFYALKRIMTEGDEEQKNALRFYSKVRKKLTNLDGDHDQTLEEQKKIYTKALKALNISPKIEYQEKFQPYFASNQLFNWEDLSDSDQVAKMQGMLRFSLIAQCQLTLSWWNPTHKIEVLIHELKNNGPHEFPGLFGKSYYSTPPVPYRNVGGRQIFSWKPGTRLWGCSIMSHAIVVVGAEKEEDRESIYFIDPNDPSDPSDLSSQRIYVMSYYIFRENVFDQFGAILGNRPGPYPRGVFRKMENSQANHEPL